MRFLLLGLAAIVCASCSIGASGNIGGQLDIIPLDIQPVNTIRIED